MSDFWGKNVQNSISAGAPPQTHLGSLQRSFAGGAYSAPLDPMAAFKGLIDWLSMVLRLHQHNIGYTADGFYRSDDPTNSVKALKEGG